MGYGSTSILTPAIAEAICEEWMAGKRFNEIAEELRDDGHTVWPADITCWSRKNTQVEIGGEALGFRELLTSVYALRVMDMINEMIQIADKAAAKKECHHATRNRINARWHAIQMMTPKHVRLDEALALGGVTLVAVENKAFDEKVN